MHRNPADAYEAVEKATLTGRELEAHVLSKAALLLEEVQRNWDGEGREERLELALKYNQRLWTFFQAEVSKSDNPLPEQVKRNLLALSVMVDKRIFDIMVEPIPDKLDLIISINRNIAAGLRGDTGEMRNP
jgi:flagellar biosynthesis activator protein FlaF